MFFSYVLDDKIVSINLDKVAVIVFPETASKESPPDGFSDVSLRMDGKEFIKVNLSPSKVSELRALVGMP